MIRAHQARETSAVLRMKCRNLLKESPELFRESPGASLLFTSRYSTNSLLLHIASFILGLIILVSFQTLTSSFQSSGHISLRISYPVTSVRLSELVICLFFDHVRYKIMNGSMSEWFSTPMTLREKYVFLIDAILLCEISWHICLPPCYVTDGITGMTAK